MNPSTDTVPGRRRRQLLDAAVLVFGERGYHATSVADILERAGVARGTFYKYFDSKKDCFEAALDDILGRLLPLVQQLDMSQPRQEKELVQFFRQVALLATSDPALSRFARVLLSEGPGIETSFARKLNAFYDETAAMTVRYLDAANRAGQSRPIDSQVVARCILGMVKEVIFVWANDPGQKADLPHMIEQIIEFAFYGLLPRAASP